MKNKIGKRGNWAKEHEFLQSNRVLCDNKTEDVKSLFVIFLFFFPFDFTETPGIILHNSWDYPSNALYYLVHT